MFDNQPFVPAMIKNMINKRAPPPTMCYRKVEMSR